MNINEPPMFQPLPAGLSNDALHFNRMVCLLERPCTATQKICQVLGLLCSNHTFLTSFKTHLLVLVSHARAKIDAFLVIIII